MTIGTTIPVSAPSITYREIKAVEECLAGGWITQGPQVKAFEAEFAEWIGVPYGVACSSGTTALHLALAALGIGPGDDVLVPDVSFVATANAVRYTGATPVLCDIDRQSWGIDPYDAAKKRTRRTRAIIAVHLYGRRADIGSLLDLGLPIVEDAAQAFGLGNLASRTSCAIFSFYGNKVITTGEGGMLVTRDQELATRARALRGHAMEGQYFHTTVGFNYRMTDMQAAIGRVQLARAPELLYKRRRVFDAYDFVLRGAIPYTVPTVAPWQFTAQFPNRGRTMDMLSKADVETRPCFVPMHRLPMYELDDRRFPVATGFAKHTLSLPTYPDLPLEDVRRIAEICRDSLA